MSPPSKKGPAKNPPVTIVIEKKRLVTVTPEAKEKKSHNSTAPAASATKSLPVSIETPKQQKRIEKVFWSRKHDAIVAKVSSSAGIKVVSMEELHKESGEIFVNYMTRLIMEEVNN